MNEIDQETLAISHALKLLDEGKDIRVVLAATPAEFRENVSEYSEMLKWIETEREDIAVPSASLEKVLAAITLEEPKKAPAPAPLAEIIPAKQRLAAVIQKPKKADSIQARPAMIAEKTEEKIPAKSDISWGAFFGKDSAFAQPAKITDWKVWLPTGAIALLLIILGVNNGMPGVNTPDLQVAETSSSQGFAVSPAADPSAPAAGRKAALASAPGSSRSGSSGTIDDKTAALSSASDSEAAAANGSDSDLAARDAAPLNAAGNSYNENTL